MIKFLWILVLLLLLCVVFMSRNSRKATNKPASKDRPAIDMLPCRWCSVHVPAGDAVRGKHGAYCSAVHKQKAEP